MKNAALLAGLKVPCPVCSGPAKPTGRLVAEYLNIGGLPGRLLTVMLDHGPTVEFDLAIDLLQVARERPARALTESMSKLRPLVAGYFVIKRLGYRGPRAIALVPEARWPTFDGFGDHVGTTPCPSCGNLLPIPSRRDISETACLSETEDILLEVLWEGGLDGNLDPSAPILGGSIVEAIFVGDPNGGPDGHRGYQVLARAIKSISVKLAPFGVAIAKEAGTRGYRLRIETPWSRGVGYFLRAAA